MNILTILLSMLFFNGPLQKGASQSTSLKILKEGSSCNDFWIAVHAIEYLAELGYKKEAESYIENELRPFAEVPEKRIGLWRAKYKVATTESSRVLCLNKIRDAYLDKEGQDRIHAAETLAKLGYSFRKFNDSIVSKDLLGDGMLFSFSLWGNTIPASDTQVPEFRPLFEQLENDKVMNRKLAGYALGFFHQLPANCWDTLAHLALSEPQETEAYSYLLGSAYALYDFRSNQRMDTFQKIRERLLLLEYSFRKADRIEVCRALAVHAKKEDLLVLNRLLQVNNGILGNLDVQVAAAYALLKFDRQTDLNHKHSIRQSNKHINDKI